MKTAKPMSIDEFRSPDVGVSPAMARGSALTPKKHSLKTDGFIQYVPLSWISAASEIPGKAPVCVGLALWLQVGLLKTHEVTLTRTMTRRWHVSHKAVRRGLVALEKLGLIEVQRAAGKSPRVTVKTVA